MEREARPQVRASRSYTRGVASPGRLLILAGVLLVLVGILVSASPQIPWLGRLPGDVRIERPGFRFYLPLTTCVLLSLFISALVYLISRLR